MIFFSACPCRKCAYLGKKEDVEEDEEYTELRSMEFIIGKCANPNNKAQGTAIVVECPYFLTKEK